MKFNYFNFAKTIPTQVRWPFRQKKIIVPIVRWAIVALIAAMYVTFDLQEKVISLSVPFRGGIAILIGIFLGVGLEFFESFFKDFLTRRDYKRKGYFMCKTCNGNGWTPKSSRHWFFRIHKANHIHGTCNVCHGEGYVDWVQNVVGPRGQSVYDGVQSGPSP
jgi:hypothetical protein